MSLRTRLVIALGTMLTVALVAAGVLLVSLTRAGLLERVDRELQTLAASAAPIQRLMNLTGADGGAGRSLAVIRLNRQGVVTLALPSGFPDSPDPLPALPAWAGGVPASVYGQIMDVPSVDGSIRYHVLVTQGRNGAALVIAAALASVDETTGTLVRILLLIGGVTIAGLLLLAWLVVRQGLLPLERIAGTAQRIADGDLSQRAGVPHDDTEVGRLGTAFDSMLDQVEDAFVEQRAALDAKARSEDRLRRFVADASHELRTPLTAVRGYADLYRAGGLAEPAALDAAMERIGTESRRMSSLVDDLLMLAHLDEGRPLRRDPVDLSRICEEAVADARAVEPSRPLVGAIEPGLLLVGDEDRLRQVVGNLLANVRVHTPAGAPVEMILQRDGAGAELRVVDHGPGVDPEHAPRVFDRFYRADPGRSRERGGAGLGLSIVASIVVAHGGRLWHEATPSGGATFGAWLPFTGSSQPDPGEASAEGPSL
jgi:two-component system, OmpR family, sensor kinase